MKERKIRLLGYSEFRSPSSDLYPQPKATVLSYSVSFGRMQIDTCHHLAKARWVRACSSDLLVQSFSTISGRSMARSRDSVGSSSGCRDPSGASRERVTHFQLPLSSRRTLLARRVRVEQSVVGVERLTVLRSACRRRGAGC